MKLMLMQVTYISDIYVVDEKYLNFQFRFFIAMIKHMLSFDL
jgi:hypothetical protein